MSTLYFQQPLRQQIITLALTTRNSLWIFIMVWHVTIGSYCPKDELALYSYILVCLIFSSWCTNCGCIICRIQVFVLGSSTPRFVRIFLWCRSTSDNFVHNDDEIINTRFQVISRYSWWRPNHPFPGSDQPRNYKVKNVFVLRFHDENIAPVKVKVAGSRAVCRVFHLNSAAAV